jgi:hypothetical protein
MSKKSNTAISIILPVFFVLSLINFGIGQIVTGAKETEASVSASISNELDYYYKEKSRTETLEILRSIPNITLNLNYYALSHEYSGDTFAKESFGTQTSLDNYTYDIYSYYEGIHDKWYLYQPNVAPAVTLLEKTTSEVVDSKVSLKTTKEISYNQKYRDLLHSVNSLEIIENKINYIKNVLGYPDAYKLKNESYLASSYNNRLNLSFSFTYEGRIREVTFIYDNHFFFYEEIVSDFIHPERIYMEFNSFNIPVKDDYVLYSETNTIDLPLRLLSLLENND